jgi:hypothetical protein
VEALAAGTLVCLEGKLRKKKRLTRGEERWETVVQAWTIQPVLHPATTLAAEG